MTSLQTNVDSSNSHTLQESNHKKRRKIKDCSGDHNSLRLIPWKSETEQRNYTSKLIHVLHRSRQPSSNPISGREVHAAADRVLAVMARGRTQWSRAILASPLSRWKLQYWRRRHKKVKKAANGLRKKRTPKIRRRLSAVQKKARVLSRLVPGCRKVSLPNLLEEATDYISALEMKVRAMTTLTELLAGFAPPPAPLESS